MAISASIHKAAKHGNVEQLKAMIAAGTDLTQRNIYGKTPLGVALQYDQKEAIQVLRRHGAKE